MRPSLREPSVRNINSRNVFLFTIHYLLFTAFLLGGASRPLSKRRAKRVESKRRRRAISIAQGNALGSVHHTTNSPTLDGSAFCILNYLTGCCSLSVFTFLFTIRHLLITGDLTVHDRYAESIRTPALPAHHSSLITLYFSLSLSS